MESDWTPDARLRMRVDEVLHYLWDPIGVNHVPEARDEYYTYSAKAFVMLKEGASATEIADHLRKMTTERMGLDGLHYSGMSEQDIAEVLIDWKRNIFEVP